MPELTHVRCYSGHTYAQEPQSFLWHGQRQTVSTVRSVRRQLAADSGIETVVFLVETTDGQLCRLAYDEAQDAWSAAQL